MKSFSTAFVVLAVLAALASLAAAQSFGDFFPGFAAAQSSGAGTGGGRSNTGNPGPILFPNTPPGSETSGVVVGASGFGFVPPGGRTGGARGVYPNINSLVAGPSLRPALGPGLGPLGGGPLVSASGFRLGPLRSPLGAPLGSPLGAPLGSPLGVAGARVPTTRLRPSVSYSTTHGAAPSAVAPGGVVSPSIAHSPLLWRLPGRSSSSFLSGNTAAFTSSFGSEDYP